MAHGQPRESIISYTTCNQAMIRLHKYELANYTQVLSLLCILQVAIVMLDDSKQPENNVQYAITYEPISKVLIHMQLQQHNFINKCVTRIFYIHHLHGVGMIESVTLQRSFDCNT